jgi:hypothetical protein
MHHEKMREVVADPELFSLWVKLGLLAIDTWAARRDGEFIVSDRQLINLTGKKRGDAAHRVMRRLVAASPLSARYLASTGEVSDKYGDGSWEVRFSNLLRKQGFEQKNSPTTAAPYKSTIQSHVVRTTPTQADEPDAAVVAQARRLFVN